MPAKKKSVVDVVKEKVEEVVETVVETVVPEEPKKYEYIYKSLSDFKLILRSTFNERRLDGNGFAYDAPVGPIWVLFLQGTFVLDERSAQPFGYSVDEMAGFFEKSHEWNKGFKLIWGPDFVPDEGLLKYAAACDKAAIDTAPKVRQGARAL